MRSGQCEDGSGDRLGIIAGLVLSGTARGRMGVSCTLVQRRERGKAGQVSDNYVYNSVKGRKSVKG